MEAFGEYEGQCDGETTEGGVGYAVDVEGQISRLGIRSVEGEDCGKDDQLPHVPNRREKDFGESVPISQEGFPLLVH